MSPTLASAASGHVFVSFLFSFRLLYSSLFLFLCSLLLISPTPFSPSSFATFVAHFFFVYLFLLLHHDFFLPPVIWLIIHYLCDSLFLRSPSSSSPVPGPARCSRWMSFSSLPLALLSHDPILSRPLVGRSWSGNPAVRSSISFR